MGKLLENITPEEAEFISKQHVFFIGTAPNSSEHHVNVSPRAPGASVQVIDENTVAICDLTGSGSETAAHLMQNGRITLMFTNLNDGPPKILRLFGSAQILLPNEVDPSLLAKFPKAITSSAGFRAVYYISVHRVTSSCGYSMPIMTYDKHRTILDEYTQVKGKEGMQDYQKYKNAFSIDGIPSIAHVACKDTKIDPEPEDGYVFGEVDENGKHNLFHDDLNQSAARDMAMGRTRKNVPPPTTAMSKAIAPSSANMFSFATSFGLGLLVGQLIHMSWLGYNRKRLMN